MKKLLLATFCIALSMCTANAKSDQPDSTARTNISAETMSANLDALFNHLAEKKIFNGNVLVAMDGKQVFFRSVGLANIKTNEPLTSESPFELASVSKQFTAAGIMVLIEKKKLTLDQKVETIFPDFPYKGVTVKMLLNHLCGLPDYMELFNEHWDSTRIATNRDIIPMLIKYKPAVLFQPGEKFQYSNTGYALLACIIEKVSKKSYTDFIKQEVFKPLGMNHSFIYSRRLHPQNIPHYAFGYVQDDNDKYILPDETSPYNPVYFLDGIHGDGCVNTTTGDMLIWMNAVQQRKLLSKASWDMTLTPGRPADGKESTYGFGWMIGVGPKSGKVISHSGSWPGYTTYDVLYLDRNISIVMLTNMEQAAGITGQTIDAIKKIVLGLDYKKPEPFVKKKAAEIDKSVYTSYAGTYNLFPDFDVVVTTSDGRLYMEPTGQGKMEILPESPTLFFVADFPVGIEFIPAEAGKPTTSFTLLQNGQKYPAKRK